MNSDTCVIIPVFNEAPVLADVLKVVTQHFSKVICIDDGSSDGSAEILAEAGVHIIRHRTNHGQGAALRTGIRQALLDPDTRYFITYDADGQHSVHDAISMLDSLKDKGVDVALGSRFLGEVEGMSFWKHWFLKAAVVFSNKTTGLQLTDTHNGLRAFNRRFAERLSGLRCNGMAHASEIIYKIRDGNFSYTEIPVTIRYTDYSRAKGQSILNTFSILRELAAQGRYDAE